MTGPEADDFEFDPGEKLESPIKFLNDAGDFRCGFARDKPIKEVSCDKQTSSTDFKIYKYQVSGRSFKGLHFPVTPLDPWSLTSNG